jgi:hypothetical protein
VVLSNNINVHIARPTSRPTHADLLANVPTCNSCDEEHRVNQDDIMDGLQLPMIAYDSATGNAYARVGHVPSQHNAGASMQLHGYCTTAEACAAAAPHT